MNVENLSRQVWFIIGVGVGIKVTLISVFVWALNGEHRKRNP